MSAQLNPLCELFESRFPREGAMLLFGASRPAQQSPISLAYIHMSDFGQRYGINESQNNTLFSKPKAFFFKGYHENGTAWSRDEQDTGPLPWKTWGTTWPCDDITQAGRQQKIGEFLYSLWVADQTSSSFDVLNASEEVMLQDVYSNGTPAEYCDNAEFKQLVDALVVRYQSNTVLQDWVAKFKDLCRVDTCQGSDPDGNSIPMSFRPEACLLEPEQQSQTAGLLSIRVVDSGDGVKRILFLTGNGVSSARLATPWDMTKTFSLVMPNNPGGNAVAHPDNDPVGYGRFILPGDQSVVYHIDAPPGGLGIGWLDIWHTTSSWDGGSGRPYGVYTTKSSVKWPLDSYDPEYNTPTVTPDFMLSVNPFGIIYSKPQDRLW